MEVKRIVFNLNDFITELQNEIEENHECIHDIIEKYNTFLKRAGSELRTTSIKYVQKKVDEIGNPLILSHIRACHKPYF